jgi:hypothetical protein
LKLIGKLLIASQNAQNLHFVEGNKFKNTVTFLIRTEIIEREDKEEPHIKFISRDGLSKAILKIEDAVK